MISEYEDEYEGIFRILLKKRERLKIIVLRNSKRKTKLKIIKK